MDMLGLLAYMAVTFMAVLGVVTILMPFFVLRIRHELIAVNRKLERLIQLFESPPPPAVIPGPRAGGAPVRFCRNCGAPNPAGEAVCSACRSALPTG
jgi:hypothetical protein